MTINSLLEIWLDEYVKLRVKYHTYCMYRDMTDTHFKPFFEDKEIKEINNDEIYRFIKVKAENGNLKTGKGLSGKSINRMLTVLKNFFHWCLQRGYVEKNPCDGISRVKEQEKDMEAFTKEEHKKIEEYAYEHREEYLGIILALHTGMRVGELVALKWSDIDFKKKIITIRSTKCRLKNDEGKYIDWEDTPKTKSSKRMIPISGELITILKEIERKGEYVLTNKKGEAYSVRAYQHKFERLLVKLKIRHLGFHALRHTFATRAIEVGADVKTVSELLGHKNTSITLNLYIHSLMESKRTAIKRLDGLFFHAKSKIGINA